jgi:hypothetical protein
LAQWGWFLMVTAAVVILVTAGLLVDLNSPARADDKPNDSPAASDAANKAERASRLALMRGRAEIFEIARLIDGESQQEKLCSEPVLRYSDQPRGFVDATLWCWGTPGRPAAIAKVEMVVDANGAPFWQYCLASIADGPIAVDFGGARRFATNKAGIELKPVPGATAPDDKPAPRLRQMKELFARFSATIHSKHVDTKELVQQEMRPLASPIHLYANTDVNDGAIFGLTTNGTNPDLLLLVELRSVAGMPKSWHYGIVRMTDGELHVRIDDNEVWNSPYQAPRITWTSVFLRRTE